MIACKTYCASTVADYEALYVALQAAGYQPARSLLTTAQCGNECRWYFYIFVDGSFFWMDMAESDVSKDTRHSATPWQDGDPL